MSKELPALRAREVVRILERAGFVKWRQKGSHLTMYRASDQRVLTVPIHFSKTVPKGTLRAIIRQAGAHYGRVSEFGLTRASRNVEWRKWRKLWLECRLTG